MWLERSLLPVMELCKTFSFSSVSSCLCILYSINHFLQAECQRVCLLAINKHRHPSAGVTFTYFHCHECVCLLMCVQYSMRMTARPCVSPKVRRASKEKNNTWQAVKLRLCICTFSPDFYSTMLCLISLSQSRLTLSLSHTRAQRLPFFCLSACVPSSLSVSL